MGAKSLEGYRAWKRMKSAVEFAISPYTCVCPQEQQAAETDD